MLIERSKSVDGLQNKKPKLPVGESGKLFLDQKKQEQSVYFGWVKNEVLKVNSNINIDDFSFDFIEGKPTSMGLFAENVLSEQSFNIISAEGQVFEIYPEHNRSAFLGRSSKGAFRDFDVKGIGLVDIIDGGKKTIFSPGRKREFGGISGLLDRDVAFYDFDMSEEFFKAEIRTYRVLAIIELKELIINGRKISLEEAIKEDIIDENFHPVAEVRAYYGTRARINDIAQNSFSETRRDLFLKDAKKIFAQEFNLKEPLSDEEYLKKFAEVLGHNIGLMHKNGWIHNYLSIHNITLDCRIVDLDSVSVFNYRKLVDNDKAKEDFTDAQNTLFFFVDRLMKKPFQPYKRNDEYAKIFKKSYNAAFPECSFDF